MDFSQHCAIQEFSTHTGTQAFPVNGSAPLCVLLLQEGSCSLVEDTGALLPVAPKDLILTGSPCTIVPLQPCRLEGLFLAGAAAVDYASELGGPTVLKASEQNGIDAMFSQLFLARGKLSPAEESAAAYGFLCRLASLPSGEKRLPPLVAVAVGEIRTHFAEVYGVEELADTLMVSKSHLIRSFTAAVGISPGKYLTLVRLEHAKTLLLRDEYPLEVVATLCGFSGAGYLCKVFKKETGESPIQWKRRVAAPKASAPPTEWEAQLYL